MKLIKKINNLKLSFKINFVVKHEPIEIFEFNHELINKVKSKTKEIIEKYKSNDLSTEKSYRRKIKKKIVEKSI